MEESFGPHITIDLKGCPKEILSNYNLHFDYKRGKDFPRGQLSTQTYAYI